MDCREFRSKHVAYVDDILPMVEMEAMHRHVRMCCGCARHDTVVRRSLLLVRNLPEVQPSPDFMARLNARLGSLHSVQPRRRWFLPTAARFTALAAGIAVVGFLAYGVAARSEPEVIRLAPVVATVPEQLPSPVSDPAFVASMSTGIPVWPTVLMLDQAQIHMANLELQQASFTR